jgi:hypothetical protein
MDGFANARDYSRAAITWATVIATFDGRLISRVTKYCAGVSTSKVRSRWLPLANQLMGTARWFARRFGV